MPVTSMLFVFGTELLVIDTLRYFEAPAPCRISSIPKGSQLRPGIYSIIEDVCAVDGSGGTAFREALNKRYEASHVFRAMLRRLGAFWAFGAQTMAVVCTILIFTIQHEAAYVVGWSAPFIWAGVWTVITYYYVLKKLREEQQAWAEELEEKAGGMPVTDVSPEVTRDDLAPDELPHHPVATTDAAAGTGTPTVAAAAAAKKTTDDDQPSSPPSSVVLGDAKPPVDAETSVAS